MPGFSGVVALINTVKTINYDMLDAGFLRTGAGCSVSNGHQDAPPVISPERSKGEHGRIPNAPRCPALPASQEMT